MDQEYTSTQESDGYQVFQLSGLYKNQDVIFTVTVDEDNQIAGFFIQ
ncbi:DUF3887 domain-containing protein [Bacillus dakarensis]